MGNALKLAGREDLPRRCIHPVDIQRRSGAVMVFRCAAMPPGRKAIVRRGDDPADVHECAPERPSLPAVTEKTNSRSSLKDVRP